MKVALIPIFLITMDGVNLRAKAQINLPLRGQGKSGKKITIIHEQQRKRYTLTTAITTKKIIHDEVMLGSANGKSFLKFMKNLINKLPQEETYYILMDNARIHHYHKIHKFIKRKENIKILYNLPYTPETNPIEKVFKDVKQYLRNVVIKHDNIIDKIKKSLLTIKEKNLTAYFKKAIEYCLNM